MHIFWVDQVIVTPEKEGIWEYKIPKLTDNCFKEIFKFENGEYLKQNESLAICVPSQFVSI